MKKVILICLVIVLAIVGWKWYASKKNTGNDVAKQGPIALKKHSETFNNSVSTAMSAYFDIAAGLVDGDTTRAKDNGRKFIQLLNGIPMDELKKDSANIYDIAMSSFEGIKANAESMLAMTDIQEMRKDFSMVSENLYPFFKLINYEGDKMYWQNCPMAFGDDKGANWISKTTETVNPYLGKNHPEFKATMLHCGMVKDTIKAQ